MFARSLAFVVWAGAAASAVAWGYKLFTPSQPVPAHAVLAGSTAALGADLSRLFGAEPAPAQPDAAAPPPPEASRFQLIGVAAPRAGAAPDEGVALIAVDGKPPRAFRVGRVVDGEQVLLAVHARGAAVGPRNGSATLHLELPPLPPPATGVPVAAAPLAPAAQPMPMPGVPLPQANPAAAFQAAQMSAQMAGPGVAAQARLRALRNAGAVPDPVMPAPPQLAQPPSGMAPMAEQPQVGADGRSLR